MKVNPFVDPYDPKVDPFVDPYGKVKVDPFDEQKVIDDVQKVNPYVIDDFPIDKIRRKTIDEQKVDPYVIDDVPFDKKRRKTDPLVGFTFPKFPKYTGIDPPGGGTSPSDSGGGGRGSGPDPPPTTTTRSSQT